MGIKGFSCCALIFQAVLSFTLSAAFYVSGTAWAAAGAVFAFSAGPLAGNSLLGGMEMKKGKKLVRSMLALLLLLAPVAGGEGGGNHHSERAYPA